MINILVPYICNHTITMHLLVDRISLCHGPISQTSVEQVLSKFNTEEGHFLVRESRSIDDAYTLSVCHSKKVMHYRIVHHEDGTYSFRDPDRMERNGTLEQSGQPHEYEKFPSLHDLIKSYHQKAVSLKKVYRNCYVVCLTPL